MRMTLLYNIYNLLLSVSFLSIKVNSYDSFLKMENKKNKLYNKDFYDFIYFYEIYLFIYY